MSEENQTQQPENLLDGEVKAAVSKNAVKGETDETKEKCCGPFFYGSKAEDIMPYNWAYYKEHTAEIKSEIFAGVTVAFAQVSESIAFAFIAGLGPLFGLHAAWIIGFCTSMFGSRPGMINGATGVRAAVIAPYIKDLGVGYVFYIVLLISCFQTLFGMTRLCSLITLVPRTVMIGFVNGLAIILGMGQVGQFQWRKPISNSNVTGTFDVWNDVKWFPKSVPAEVVWLPAEMIGLMCVLIAVTVIVIVLVPMFKYSKIFPAAITGILMATLVEHAIFRPAFGVSSPTIGSVSDPASWSGGLPKLFFNDPQFAGQIPTLDWDCFMICVGPAFIAAAAGAVECVLTMEVVNDMTFSGNDSPNQQLYALSLGNFLSGLFGTMGGGATIGLSVINCSNGANGKFRISGVIASITVLIFILALPSLIQAIPSASLVGLMVIVCYKTFDWDSLMMILASSLPQTIRRKNAKLDSKINRTDAITICVVTVVTLVQDLFFAVLAGILFTGVVYAWQSGLNIKLNSYLTNQNSKKIYAVQGPLFFGSAQRFVKLFNYKDDPNKIVIDFRSDAAKIYDFSGFNALNIVSEKYQKLGKHVVVKKLDLASQTRVKKADYLVKNFEYGEDADEELSPIRLSVVTTNTVTSKDPQIDRAA